MNPRALFDWMEAMEIAVARVNERVNVLCGYGAGSLKADWGGVVQMLDRAAKGRIHALTEQGKAEAAPYPTPPHAPDCPVCGTAASGGERLILEPAVMVYDCPNDHHWMVTVLRR